MDILTWAGAFLVCIAGVIAARRTETHGIADAAVGRRQSEEDEGVRNKDRSLRGKDKG
jgi:hypothetical protein